MLFTLQRKPEYRKEDENAKKLLTAQKPQLEHCHQESLSKERKKKTLAYSVAIKTRRGIILKI